MKPRIGRNAVFVLLLATENRKDVAAETGLSNASYSSTTGNEPRNDNAIAESTYRR